MLIWTELLNICIILLFQYLVLKSPRSCIGEVFAAKFAVTVPAPLMVALVEAKLASPKVDQMPVLLLQEVKW